MIQHQRLLCDQPASTVHEFSINSRLFPVIVLPGPLRGRSDIFEIATGNNLNPAGGVTSAYSPDRPLNEVIRGERNRGLPCHRVHAHRARTPTRAAVHDATRSSSHADGFVHRFLVSPDITTLSPRAFHKLIILMGRSSVPRTTMTDTRRIRHTYAPRRGHQDATNLAPFDGTGLFSSPIAADINITYPFDKQFIEPFPADALLEIRPFKVIGEVPASGSCQAIHKLRTFSYSFLWRKVCWFGWKSEILRHEITQSNTKRISTISNIHFGEEVTMLLNEQIHPTAMATVKASMNDRDSSSTKHSCAENGIAVNIPKKSKGEYVAPREMAETETRWEQFIRLVA